MKKLLMLAAFAGFASQISAEYKLSAGLKAAKESVFGNPTHFCACDNGSLETINGYKQCSATGYYGKYDLTPEGVRFYCGQKSDTPVEDKNTEDASCAKRCWWSGFNKKGTDEQGWVYSVQARDFEHIPTKSEFEQTKADRRAAFDKTHPETTKASKKQ
jgi:hypothetical protein